MFKVANAMSGERATVEAIIEAAEIEHGISSEQFAEQVSANILKFMKRKSKEKKATTEENREAPTQRNDESS